MATSIQHITHGSKAYLEEVALRQLVLRDPLGLKYTPEQLEAEISDHHFGLYLDNKLVACMLLTTMPENVAKMRQVAVHPDMQGKKYGAQLVRYFEGFCKAAGFEKISLCARNTAMPFYKSLGYEVVSEEFMEVGIPHHSMEKCL